MARLRNTAALQRISVQRLQRRVAFERLLARAMRSGAWVLKGGFALELRYGWVNRPTLDIDLRSDQPLREALVQLRDDVQIDLNDFFSFELGEVEAALHGAPGGTVRVGVVARVAGVQFAAFHLDVSSGDAMLGEPQLLAVSDLLDFAGIEPARIAVYPIAQHLAEKLHAYTLPREDNTRVKDFVDLVIIATIERVQAEALLDAVRATFAIRGTHPIPNRLPEPPARWSRPYAAIAAEALGARQTDLGAGYAIAAAFWDPLLAGPADGLKWDPEFQVWSDQR
ncbi:MAG: nucleotidyl transferase AbiEii/AbiGii toxin family protein [Dehalococcoidia bacterium]